MNDSSTLLTIGVRETGLKSESTLSAGVVFGTGITFADFQRDGMTPSRTDALKIEHKGRQSAQAFSRRNHAAISSGPADECSFVASRAFSVSSIEM